VPGQVLLASAWAQTASVHMILAHQARVLLTDTNHFTVNDMDF